MHRCVKVIVLRLGVASIPTSLARYLKQDNTNGIVYHQEEEVVGSKL